MHRLSLVILMIFVAATMPLAAPAQETSLRAWPEYQVIMWQGGSAAKQPDKFPLYYQRLQEMGVSAGMVYGDGDLRPVLAAKFPYYVENMVNRGLCLKFSSKVTDWDAFVTQWKNDRSEDQCVRDYSLDDPEWQNWARRQVQDLVRKNQDHAPLLYDLRDELSTTISANPFDYHFHPLALNGFREWLNHIPPTVVVPADARVKVWNYFLPPAKDLPAGTSPIRLIAFERNMTYRMGEDLQQSADNSAMTGDISITAQLPAPKHAYDLRSGKYLGHSAKLTLNVSSDVPTLIAVSEVLLPAENLVQQLLR